MADDNEACNGNGSTANELPPSLTEFPKPDDTLAVMTIDPGKDVITELSKFSRLFGALYTEKATGTVSCATLYDPRFKTRHTFTGSYIIVNIYGSLYEEGGADIEDGLWVLLGNKNGDAFWGKASKPLTAETPVKVWIVR
ncbi:hypothetical protein R1sor_016660 [Riccia sorocarpa]|uniref:PPC domain-containing protein n=1 Tax=Riccia sorocarpa TaxID=122646 RepID=A0ABD3HHN2_9MARC